MHVPYARRCSPTNMHDYFLFSVRNWKVFWFALWTFLIEKCSQNCVRWSEFASDLYFLRKIEKSTKLGPKLIPSALLNIYRYMQIDIDKLLYINVLVEVLGIHWTQQESYSFCNFAINWGQSWKIAVVSNILMWSSAAPRSRPWIWTLIHKLILNCYKLIV